MRTWVTRPPSAPRLLRPTISNACSSPTPKAVPISPRGHRLGPLPVGSDGVPEVLHGGEGATGRVAARRGRELAGDDLAVLHQDGAAGRVHRLVRAGVLLTRPRIHLAVLAVARLPQRRAVLRRRVGAGGDGLRAQRLGPAGVGPAGQRLGRDDAEQVVLHRQPVDGARRRAVEDDTERAAVGGAVAAELEVFGDGPALTHVDGVDPRQVGAALPQHLAGTAGGDDDVRSPVRGGRQVGGLPGPGLPAGDGHPGVGVDVEGRVVLPDEPDRDHGVLGQSAEGGAAVVVAEDAIGGPAVLGGVAVGTPLAHAATVTVTEAHEGERGVGGDGLRHVGFGGAHVHHPADRGADEQRGGEADRRGAGRGGPPAVAEGVSDDETPPAMGPADGHSWHALHSLVLAPCAARTQVRAYRTFETDPQAQVEA